MGTEDDSLNISEMFTQTIRRQLERRFVGSSALQLATKALLSGGELVAPGEFEWDCSGDCNQPHIVFRHEVAEDFFGAVKREAAMRRSINAIAKSLNDAGLAPDSVVVRKKPRRLGIRVTVQVRCRECPNCLEARRRLWRRRTVAEWEASARSWWGTLTLRPAAHDYYKRRAQQEQDIRANPFEGLDASGQFLARHRQIGVELTLWLKRVRKNSKANFRYIIVSEAHESGLPHYHFMLSESSEDEGKVKYDIMRNAWRAGFVKINLVQDKRAAGYVCKYLGKSLLARVRASKHYGSANAQACSQQNTNVCDFPIRTPQPPSSLLAPARSESGAPCHPVRPIGGLARELGPVSRVNASAQTEKNNGK